jgi:hypothetical protein
VLSVRGLDRSDSLTDLVDPGAPHTSRIDGLAWRYEVDGRVVSIALDPDVFAPDGEFPLRESVDLASRPPRPV